MTFSFTYTTENGKKRYTIPLISVVPVPYLQIHNVNLAFSTEISTTDGGELIGKISAGDKVKVETTETTDFSSALKVNVNIKASTADMPMGISHLLRAMQNEISVKTIEETVKTTTLKTSANRSAYRHTGPATSSQNWARCPSAAS